MDVIETGNGMDSYGSEQGPVTDSCEHDNVPSVSIKGEKYLDELSGC
jgi:hypothetical protein